LKRYPLEGLLAIRVFREDAAIKDLSAAESWLKTAMAETENRRQEFNNYRIWHREEVERRYQAIMGREMSQGDLEDFKAGLAWLDGQILKRQEAVAEAEKLEDEAREKLQRAKAVLREATQAREKISYHRGQWIEGAAREEERVQDLELEEFKPVLFE
jgi:type III secretion protein O